MSIKNIGTKHRIFLLREEDVTFNIRRKILINFFIRILPTSLIVSRSSDQNR